MSIKVPHVCSNSCILTAHCMHLALKHPGHCPDALRLCRARGASSDTPMRRPSTGRTLTLWGGLYFCPARGQPADPARACNRAGALALQGDAKRGVRCAPDQRGECACQRQPLQAGSLHGAAGHLSHGGGPPSIWVGALQHGGAGPIPHVGKGLIRPAARARPSVHADGRIGVTYLLELLNPMSMGASALLPVAAASFS